MDNVKSDKGGKGIWVVLALIVVVLIIAFTMKGGKDTTNLEDVNTSLPVEEEVEGVEDVTTGSVNTGVGAAPISYQNALIKYKDKRIQFDPTCQARPNVVTYKDNTGIMLDNRSAETRTIKVGSTYTVKPWGFKIITLQDVYLQSKNVFVDCDESQNVATILIQE